MYGKVPHSLEAVRLQLHILKFTVDFFSLIVGHVQE
jgi:hypothetical protein